MADGALNLTLSDYTASKLTEKAKAMGVPVEDLAAMVLDARFFDYDDFTWINGDPRDPQPPYDPDEPTRDWEDIRVEWEAELERRLAAQASSNR